MVKPVKTKTKRRPNGSALSVQFLDGVRKLVLLCVPYLLSLAVAGALFGGVAAYAVNSPTFRLGEVKILNFSAITPEQAFRFCELQKGENLILLDLVNVQQVIKRKHPEFKEVTVRRVLPDRVEVLLKRRMPVAQIAYSRYVEVDKDLVILPGSSPTPLRNLTVIEGAPIPREGLVVGAGLRDAMTKKALILADRVRTSNILRNHSLTKISITDPKNIVLTVDNQIDIRIGGGHFIDRLKILDQTLNSVQLDSAKISYIDLRFDDVVIGPAK